MTENVKCDYLLFNFLFLTHVVFFILIGLCNLGFYPLEHSLTSWTPVINEIIISSSILFPLPFDWLVVLGFNATLTANVISWQSVTHYVFPGFLTPVLTQLFFPKPTTTFLACFCRGERQKYARKKSHLNWGSNSQPPGHESDTLTTEPPGCGPLPFEPNANL